MREAIVGDIESDWPKFIRRLQDLGVIKAVYGLMQGSAVQDLSQSLLEFQALTKVLLRKWRDLPVDLDDPDHRRALKSIHALSNPSEKPSTPITMSDDNEVRRQHNHNPEKWRRLGFETETPASEFEHVGYLGMMDLADYVRRFEDGFQKQLLEQSTRPSEERCPIAGASLAVTSILYEHFDIEKAEVDDVKYHLAFESNTNFDKVFTPLILQWSILHVAGLQAFFRLWNATGALQKDFNKIFDLVRILLEVVLNEAVRTTQVQEIQAQIATYQLSTLRQVQMELIEKTHEEIWDVHLRSIKDELSYEALHFVKEQRIRCLLAGAWFSTGSGNRRATFRFAKLSTNRQYLHWADFDARSESDPDVEDMFDRGMCSRSLVFSLGYILLLPNSQTLNVKISSRSAICHFCNLQCFHRASLAKPQFCDLFNLHAEKACLSTTCYHHHDQNHDIRPRFICNRRPNVATKHSETSDPKQTSWAVFCFWCGP